MSSSARDLERALRLIAITDNLRDGIEGLVARAAGAVRGGATMVQVRLKDADARTAVAVARRLAQELPVPVTVNDRADIAIAAGAAGVHVGADDLPVDVIRAMSPPGFIIGASYGSDEELDGTRGADYVGIGPVFATGTKRDAGTAIGPEGFARLRARTGLPAVGIGGIDERNARVVVDAGATGIAVVSSILGATDPERAARALVAAMA
jgi:thiamine-phosphate pyrophosphorylase